MKYVKLGPAAQQGSFFDPVTKLNLTPGAVAKVPKLAKTSVVYQTALKGQHIVDATEEEYDAYMEKEETRKAGEVKTPKKSKGKEKPEPEEDDDDETGSEDTGEEDEDEDEDTDDDTDEDEDDVDNMSKSELVAYLKESTMPEEEKKNLSKMNKEQLKAAFGQYTSKK